jgi:hypothetical protein
MTNQEMQDREDKWADLIELVNAGSMTLREANDEFSAWAAKYKNSVNA